MRLATYRSGRGGPRIGALAGDVVLDVDTSPMIGPVARRIEVLSQGFTVLEGDVIGTGTPEGVGAASGRFLEIGDEIEAEVERIGVLRNRVVAPARP